MKLIRSYIYALAVTICASVLCALLTFALGYDRELLISSVGCGIGIVGFAYGFASWNELKKHRADHVADGGSHDSSDEPAESDQGAPD